MKKKQEEKIKAAKDLGVNPGFNPFM